MTSVCPHTGSITKWSAHTTAYAEIKLANIVYTNKETSLLKSIPVIFPDTKLQTKGTDINRRYITFRPVEDC